MTNVLFVCLGNICRSPMAEAVFRHLVEQEGLSKEISITLPGSAAGMPESVRTKAPNRFSTKKGSLTTRCAPGKSSTTIFPSTTMSSAWTKKIWRRSPKWLRQAKMCTACWTSPAPYRSKTWKTLTTPGVSPTYTIWWKLAAAAFWQRSKAKRDSPPSGGIPSFFTQLRSFPPTACPASLPCCRSTCCSCLRKKMYDRRRQSLLFRTFPFCASAAPARNETSHRLQ